MKEIRGDAKSIRALLGGAKFSIDFGQNLLAQSLHENAYDHNPGFRRFCEQSGLPFAAHPEFKKADLDARQELYREIAERIWSPLNLMREVEADPAEVATA
jgi:hypothetical protein